MITPQGGTSKSASTKATAGGKPTTPSARGNTGARAGGGPRRPITPVKVAPTRNWTAIIVSAVAVLFAASIVGYGLYQVHQAGLSWKQKADAIPGIVDYRDKDPKMLTYEKHQTGVIQYPMHPPVGGTHNPEWQRCLGDVYPAAIADEHAVHSMEHGAVWITYRPDLPAAQVRVLAAKVTGNDFMLMSPYPNLDAPISIQTWGFQLKVDSASDSRIDDFIKDLREVSSQEPGATCSQGTYITATGTTPHDIDGQNPTPAPSGTPSASPTK
jgi:hypothetical protein